MGERELILDGLTVDEVMKLIGAAKGGRRRRPRHGGARDRRETLAAGGVRRLPVAAAAPAAPVAAGRAESRMLPSGLVVGGGDRELFSARDHLERPGRHARRASAARSCARSQALASAPSPTAAKNRVPGEATRARDLMCVGEGPGANEERPASPSSARPGSSSPRFSPRSICGARTCTSATLSSTARRATATRRRRRSKPVFHISCVRWRSSAPRSSSRWDSPQRRHCWRPPRHLVGRLRGREHTYHGIPVIVTYHPAALLRNPAWKRPTWEDVQLARRILDRAARPR